MKVFFEKHWQTALFGMIYASILYSLLMTQQLTNTFDGLWHQNYHHAGIPELTSGRWMLYYIDKLTMGLHADPIATLLALALFVLGFLLVLDLFELKHKTASFLTVALWVSSTVICGTISYRMTSLGYGVAFVLAILAVCVSVRMKHRVGAGVLSGILLGASMACYQAYLGVFAVVALFFVIFLCGGLGEGAENSRSKVLSALLRIVFTVVVGAVFYLASLSFFLNLHDVTLSSYNGVGDITPLSLVTELPANIAKTYRVFGEYFLLDYFKLNRMQYLGGFWLLLGTLAALVVFLAVRAWKADKLRFVILLLASLAIPVGCSAYMLLAGDRLAIQTTAGLALLVPLTMILLFSCVPKKPLSVAGIVFCLLLLYGSSMQVWFDQEAMYEGRNSSATMMTQVLDDLSEEGLLGGEYEYYFVGVPAKNDYFAVSEAYTCANGYGQIGNFWVSGSCAQLSYHGLIHQWMGFDLPISYRFYEEVAAAYPVEDLPVFPNEGYITVYDDTMVIIKISPYETYSEYSAYLSTAQ